METLEDQKSQFRLTFKEWYAIQAFLNGRRMTASEVEILSNVQDKLNRHFGV